MTNRADPRAALPFDSWLENAGGTRQADSQIATERHGRDRAPQARSGPLRKLLRRIVQQQLQQSTRQSDKLLGLTTRP